NDPSTQQDHSPRHPDGADEHVQRGGGGADGGGGGVPRGGGRVRAARGGATGGPDRPGQRVSGGPVAQARRNGAAGRHGAGGARRNGAGLPDAHGGDGGAVARVGRGGAELRRALESVRQPDQPARHRGAEAQVPAAARGGRACGRAGDVRARRRVGR
ncbi:hypothetical protein H4S06_003318, partial [Coemansia sp. BCRC 34490]